MKIKLLFVFTVATISLNAADGNPDPLALGSSSHASSVRGTSPEPTAELKAADGQGESEERPPTPRTKRINELESAVAALTAGLSETISTQAGLVFTQRKAELKGERGAPGENGKDGKDGERGAPGENGKDGVDGKDGERGASGENGKDGERGAPGENGKDGVDGKDGKDGERGAPGENGKDGVDGKDGEALTAADVLAAAQTDGAFEAWVGEKGLKAYQADKASRPTGLAKFRRGSTRRGNAAVQ